MKIGDTSFAFEFGRDIMEIVGYNKRAIANALKVIQQMTNNPLVGIVSWGHYDSFHCPFPDSVPAGWSVSKGRLVRRIGEFGSLVAKNNNTLVAAHIPEETFDDEVQRALSELAMQH